MCACTRPPCQLSYGSSGSTKFEKQVREGFLCSQGRQQVPAASPEAIAMETDVARELFSFFKSRRVRLSQRDLRSVCGCSPTPAPTSLCPVFPAAASWAERWAELSRGGSRRHLPLCHRCDPLGSSIFSPVPSSLAS